MSRILCQRAWWRIFVASVCVLAAVSDASRAQDKKLEEAKKFEPLDYVRPANLVTAGYVTPGTPLGPNLQDSGGKILGGTVYYAVFRRVGRLGDSWGIGPNFDSHFVEGENIRRGVSPHLDTEAEYLYLYQVVNDRAVHDPKLNRPTKTGEIGVALRPANENRKLTEDIASFSLRLVIDPRQITSWGYFTDAGFSLRTFDKNLQKAQGLRVVASSSPLISATLPDKDYRPGAVSRRIDHDRKLAFKVDNDKVGIAESLPLTKDRITGVRAVALKERGMHGGRRPDFVQLIYADLPITPMDYERTGGEPIRGIFRVDWKNVPMIAEGEHSVIFGFTSDAPPIDQPIRIKDSEEAAMAPADLESEFRLVADRGPAVGEAAASVAAAVGVNIPSPRPSAFEAPAPPGGGVLTPVVGGGVTGYAGGSGGGGMGVIPAGALGMARPGMFGGGMQGGGWGGGGQGQEQTDAPTINNTNINALTALQLQAQLQAQLQKMFQMGGNGGNGGNGNGCVIPEPGTLLLGLLGLPGFWWLARRKTLVPV
ncbi:MAG: PEP-CTERM sorting domain-containing protein [Gemmataceae bacterium]|nr:PEP-CTERM sorting domain-containing protein [Gemmataceae bacterium]